MSDLILVLLRSSLLAANLDVCCYSKTSTAASSHGAQTANSQTQTSPGGSFTLARSPAAVARLAPGFGARATPNLNRLASAGLSLVLALEFPCPRRRPTRN